MALQKDKMIGGQPFNYHKIKNIKIDTIGLKVTMEIGHYKDKVYREDNPNGNIKRTVKTFGGDMKMYNSVAQMTVLDLFAYCYAKIKEPIMQQATYPDTDEPAFDENGDPVMEDVDFYSDAEDILETQ